MKNTRSVLALLLCAAAVAGEEPASRELPPPPAAPEGALFAPVAEAGLAALPAWEPGADDDYRMLATAFTSSRAAIGDYDGDGRPDVYLTRRNAGNLLYRNTGDGRFEDVTKEAGVGAAGRWSTRASFADVDGDGDLDLYVCVYGAADLCYVNKGDGTFADEAVARGLGYAGASAAATFADYDRDGDLDLFVATHYDLGGPIEKRMQEIARRMRLGAMFDPALRDEQGKVVGLHPDVRGVLRFVRD
jgi:hypothetical protein